MSTTSRDLASSPVLEGQDTDDLLERFRDVRRATESICEPLEIEDYCVQSMPDASPTKWHLAHTSWFFETFVLQPNLPGYQSDNPQFRFLFNSYYNTVGEQHARPARGLLSRPTVSEVMEYRVRVDRAMEKLLGGGNGFASNVQLPQMIETGLHHEQQHQELILMDIKHAFWCNPLHPAYRELAATPQTDTRPVQWVPIEGQIHWIGHNGDGFSFDNERPRHRTYIEPCQLAERLATCGEYLDFIEDGGYARPDLWLSDGWECVQKRDWQSPLYWHREGPGWQVMTLGGMQDINPAEPVSHVSFYEADAFARWMDCTLPRETAWEAIAADLQLAGNFLEHARYHPLPAPSGESRGKPVQVFGDLWEWTSSPYVPFPGYQPPDGALGEYNGKFMCNQMVLRGGSCATPRSHIRATYRNFFPPDARWPFTGIRLAKDFA